MIVKTLLVKSAFPVILLGAAAAISAQTASPVEPVAAELPMPPTETPQMPVGMHLAPANVVKGTEAMLRPTPIIYPRCTAAIQDSCISTPAGVDVKRWVRTKRMSGHRN